MCKKIYSDINHNIIIEEDFKEGFVYLYILQSSKSNGIVSNKMIIKESEDDIPVFDTDFDGFYTIATLIIPTDSSNYFYYKDRKFYKNIQEVSILELIETNTEVSNIEIIYDYYFLLGRLKRCFINLCNKIFESGRCNMNDDRETKYKRDFIWAALNVIQYLTEFKQYEEAQRLLEEITNCNDFCKDDGKCCCQI